MEQPGSVLFTDRNDGADSLWGTRHRSVVATLYQYGTSCRWFPVHDMVKCKNLPDWNFDVWEKSKLERNDQVDEKVGR